MRKHWFMLFAGVAVFGVPVVVHAQGASVPPVAVAPTAETEPTVQSGANNAVVLANKADPESSIIIGSGELGGFEIYALSGKRLASIPGGDVGALDLRGEMVAALDQNSNSISFYMASLTAPYLAASSAAPIKPAYKVVGLCLSRNPRDGDLYAFILGGAGEIEQWNVPTNSAGANSARLVRRLALGSEAGYCVSDDRGSVYVTQEKVGAWRIDPDPETEILPEIVDIVRMGKITEEAKGIGLSPDGYVVVSDASASKFNIYDPGKDYALAGTFSIGAAGAIDAVEESGGLSIAARNFGAAYPGGLMVVQDDDNNPDGTNYKLVSWAAVASALNLQIRPVAFPPITMAVVRAVAETSPVETGGDAADDPAIWVDPTDPARSIVIATQKQSGLYVYDLSGKQLQYLPDGKMNNVDLREGFMLSGKPVALVTASNRTNDSIAIYTIDPATRMLTSVANGVQPTGFTDPYGLCMYRSAKSKKTFVFVNQGNGAMKQWELFDTGNGKVGTRLVREMKFATQVEGCVADEETGVLYVGEEDFGIWRMGAEPNAGQAKTAIAAVRDNPALKDDIEGLAIYRTGKKTGYLVASSQGNNSYALFTREGKNAYVGSFAVGANGAAGIDGISETDGLDVTSRSMGPMFPDGAMIAQDGRNISPPENQNFKIVSWRDVAKAMGLPADHAKPK